MKRFSIIQKEARCYVCGTSQNIHIHEVFFGKNRQLSIKDGCCIYLCGRHHNLSNEGIHFNKDLDLKVKKRMQEVWCEYYNKTKEDFIKRYGRWFI